MQMRTLTGAFAALALSTASLLADDYTLGKLHIEHPHARATLPGAPVSGGYMTIRNEGGTADRLIGGKAGFAGKVEIHEMKMDGDVMKMREIEGGLEIPPGSEVVLKPGGYHVMFMQLKNPMKEGENLPATLIFENAGEIEVEFTVEAIGRGHGSHGDHGTAKQE